MSDDQSGPDKTQELGIQLRRTLIENMANALNNRPIRGEKVGPQKELELWMMPTSPAALQAAKAGGSPAEIDQANAMWAEHLKSQGATEEQILMECRKYAFKLGKERGHNIPEQEMEFHGRMAERAAAYRLRGGLTPSPLAMGQ